MTIQKQRLSSFELLRIIAILFVLVGHVSVSIDLLPTGAEITSDATISILKIFISSICVGGVDIFILISGWFGIHVTKRGLAKYIYQVCFLLWLILLSFAIIDRSSLNIQTLKASFCVYNGYWFIMAYLGLYLLSPILNSFTKNSTKRNYQLTLIALYIFQCYFSWIASMVDYFNGYSITLFCILYLTSRYMRLYPIKTIYRNRIKLYICSIILITLIVTLSLKFTGTALRMLRYDNPIIILSSLCLLTIFSKFRFQSRVINKLAMSVFAVYIIHFNPFIFPYFKKGVVTIYNSTSGVITILSMILYLCLIFIVCFVIDQLRIISWKILGQNLLMKNKLIIS